MRLYLFRQWYDFIRKIRPVSYAYSFENLMALLHDHAPAEVDAVARHRRRVEHGHLSVGLKIHCLGDGSQFSTLVAGLGGSEKILDLPLSKSLLRTHLKRVPVSRRKGASFLAGTRNQSGHLAESCRKCSLCFRSTAVS